MRRSALALSLLLVAASWFFWQSSLLFPVRMFVVLLHELGHGLAAVATGGHIERIELFYGEGGRTLTAGGSRLLVLNAGYLGSLAFGCAILFCSRSQSLAGPLLALIALTTAIVTALYLRPLFSFSFLYGIAASAVLTGIATRAPADLQSFLLRFLGIFSCMYALFDIRDDVLRFGAGGGTSDATMLAAITHIPAAVWGLGWLAMSIVMLFVLRRPLFG